VSRIVNLADDIALKLAATGVRIEAPIPGKAAVGIEVPNKDVSAVALRDVLESPEFQQAPSKLTVALGRDIAGTPIIADLGKMPHLLVAGATGSGKSVCINTLILSVLFKAAPHEVKFLLIDPKVVELSTFNGIPHLMTPVVTDPKKAASALRWAVNEMEKRYQLFAAAGVREIKRYNEVVPAENRIPYIIVIIDELADLMMVAPVDVEDAICRLAQMARAAGIHLVLATQRPSVDVITGIIKANIPSRISFAVSSQVDSRTILDMAGAEKLLGKGDMLFYPVGAPKPQRVQGAFVSDNEVEEAVDFTKRQAEPSFEENVFNVEVEAINGGCEASDDLLDDAIRLVLESGQASISMLQRRFRIGYSRAARLIDMMEQMRIVGPNIGSKAREIIATAETLQGRLQKK
jgi:DNA segregation ATPase FtsK/SpoIIIE, S-DNA-T family